MRVYVQKSNGKGLPSMPSSASAPLKTETAVTHERGSRKLRVRPSNFSQSLLRNVHACLLETWGKNLPRTQNPAFAREFVFRLKRFFSDWKKKYTHKAWKKVQAQSTKRPPNHWPFSKYMTSWSLSYIPQQHQVRAKISPPDLGWPGQDTSDHKKALSENILQ